MYFLNKVVLINFINLPLKRWLTGCVLTHGKLIIAFRLSCGQWIEIFEVATFFYVASIHVTLQIKCTVRILVVL